MRHIAFVLPLPVDSTIALALAITPAVIAVTAAVAHFASSTARRPACHHLWEDPTAARPCLDRSR